MGTVGGTTVSAGWERGRGWGWVWGDDDEVGALNAMTDASRLAALRSIGRGAVYDLGVLMDHRSYTAPVHRTTEVIAYRTPEGLVRQGVPGFEPGGVGFNVGMVLCSDQAGTQLDGLAHATVGDDRHWYNGYTSEEWGRDFGPEKAGAHNIPPVIAPGVLVDVAAAQGVDELEPGHPISVDDLQAALDWAEEDVHPGDVVMVRTGVMRHWGEVGDDHAPFGGPEIAGITLASARWLVEEKGAMLIGSDNGTVECVPVVDGANNAPVHTYLLIEQGVHMGELHDLEGLSRDRVHRFCYVALCAKLRATTAGFALRPVALV